jgi:hypothetical protein
VSTQHVADIAQTFNPTEVARQGVERRAVEAVIWGMPAVNFDLMLQAMITSSRRWLLVDQRLRP